MCEQVDSQYQAQFDKTKSLEDEVKENQVIINQFRAEIASKKKSLKTYEGILKQPNITNPDTMEIAQKCQVCFKLFATSDYLQSHYKRRHLDFYTSEIRPKEDSALKQEMGEIVANQNANV